MPEKTEIKVTPKQIPQVVPSKNGKMYLKSSLDSFLTRRFLLQALLIMLGELTIFSLIIWGINGFNVVELDLGNSFLSLLMNLDYWAVILLIFVIAMALYRSQAGTKRFFSVFNDMIFMLLIAKILLDSIAVLGFLNLFIVLLLTILIMVAAIYVGIGVSRV